MLCLKCSADNPNNSRYCKNCRAVLPRNLGQPPTVAAVSLKEGVEYPEPTHHYETEQILELHELVEDVLDGNDLFQELEEHLNNMARNYKEFEEKHIRPMQELLVRESARLPDDNYNTKLSFVLKTGMQLFHEGRKDFETFFETESDDPEELEAAFARVGDGHDYICLGLEMAQERLADLQKLLQVHPETRNS